MPHPPRGAALAASLLMPAALSAAAGDTLVFFGTRETGPERGFSVAHFDPATGALTPPRFLLPAVGPSFFQIHPGGKHLYTVNTYGGEQREGFISAYALDAATGNLTLLNTAPAGGINPAYIALDRTGKFALVACFTSGCIEVVRIQDDGSLGGRTAFVQHKPDTPPAPPVGAPGAPAGNPARAHSILTDPSNRFALVCDLGLDRVFVYKFDEKTGALAPHTPAFAATKSGAGPRHVVFHPNGKIAYVLCELGNTVNVYDWDGAKGTLTEIQSVTTLPADFTGATKTAEIEVHPNGKFLYASNRGHDSIASYTIDAATGKLTPTGQVPTQGRTPRNFALDPTGKWLMASNNDSGTVITFSVDQTTGALTPTGTLTQLAAPYCERFLVVPGGSAVK